jgi:hypothetical protein
MKVILTIVLLLTPSIPNTNIFVESVSAIKNDAYLQAKNPPCDSAMYPECQV